jgi:transposase
MVNAVLYQARTGCQWRYLPGHFGPWGASWQQFRRWRASGVWEKALTLLRRAARTKAGRDPEPSMVMLDCQTVKGGRGGPGFHEAGGKYGGTFGAKRTVLIDYLGLPVAARVDSARPHDSKAGRTLLDDSMPDLPRAGEVLADLGFEPLVKGVQRRHKVTVTIRGWRKPNKPRASSPSARSGRSRTASPSSVGGGDCPAATRPPPSRPRPGCTSPASATCSPSSDPAPNNRYGSPIGRPGQPQAVAIGTCERGEPMVLRRRDPSSAS